MKAVIFGASGSTGVHLVEESLDKGFDVLALVRDPDKITVKHEKLQVVKVDIFNEEELVPHLKGSDVVFSALGHRYSGMGIFSNVTLYQDSIKSITSAMRQANATRFIGVTSWCTQSSPGNPKIMEWFIRPIIFGRILTSMAEMETYLTEKCEDINYTIIRPPMLANTLSTGQEIKTADGCQFVPECAQKIGRHDLAKFMIECFSTDQWENKIVAIST